MVGCLNLFLLCIEDSCFKNVEQNPALGQNIIDGLSILRVLVSHFNESLYPLVSLFLFREIL